jgi:hypothetical protein
MQLALDQLALPLLGQRARPGSRWRIEASSSFTSVIRPAALHMRRRIVADHRKLTRSLFRHGYLLSREIATSTPAPVGERPLALRAQARTLLVATYIPCRISRRISRPSRRIIRRARRPSRLSAAVPSGGYAFPDAAEYVSCVSHDAARSRSSEGREAAHQLEQQVEPEPSAPPRVIQSAPSARRGLERLGQEPKAGFV